MKRVRAFIALEVPGAVKDRLKRSRRSLIEELPPARWVRSESQHLTLKFLGEVQEDVLASLAASIRNEVAGYGAVAIQLDGSGFFPSSKKPRVAWIGGTAEGVEPLVEKIDQCSTGHGFTSEKNPWSLHLTQARLKTPWPRWAVDRFLEWGRCLNIPRIKCAESILYASELRPGGAVYTALERFTLL